MYISIGLFIAIIKAYAISVASLVYPIPEITVNRTIIEEPGADGVPTDARSASAAITSMFVIVTSYPELAAINIVPTTCIIAVPFILIVIPKGRTNDATSSLIPSYSCVVFKFNDNSAADDAADTAKSATLPIFFINVIGFNLVFK